MTYSPPPTVTLLPQSPDLLSLMTTLRSSATPSSSFAATFSRVSTQLIVAEPSTSSPPPPTVVTTPAGTEYTGVQQTRGVYGVSILRAGASMEESLRGAYAGSLSFGKILIQRDEETARAVRLYSKLPKDFSDRTVLILEPMLATGGSASRARELLKENGAAEEDVVFVDCVASEEGIEVITERFPGVRIVTVGIDEKMTVSKHISPGLGDFGDRFYGTE